MRTYTINRNKYLTDPCQVICQCEGCVHIQSIGINTSLTKNIATLTNSKNMPRFILFAPQNPAMYRCAPEEEMNIMVGHG